MARAFGVYDRRAPRFQVSGRARARATGGVGTAVGMTRAADMAARCSPIYYIHNAAIMHINVYTHIQTRRTAAAHPRRCAVPLSLARAVPPNSVNSAATPVSQPPNTISRVSNRTRTRRSLPSSPTYVQASQHPHASRYHNNILYFAIIRLKHHHIEVYLISIPASTDATGFSSPISTAASAEFSRRRSTSTPTKNIVIAALPIVFL